MDFLNWLYNLMERGLGVAIQRYYSIYRGVVSDNKDPEKRGRVKVYCPQVGQSEAPNKWCMPAMMGAGRGRGMFFAPEIGDTVWVSFYEGNPSEPEVYWGGWFGEREESVPETPTALRPPDSEIPEKKGIVTRAGHALIFNDEAGKESVTILWNKPKDDDPAVTDRAETAELNPDKSSVLAFDKNGGLFLKTVSSYLFQIDEDKKTVTMTSPSGSMFHIASNDSVNLVHKNGSSISMSDSAINVSGNTSKAVNVNISGQNVVLNGGGVLIGGKAIDFAVLGLKLIKWLALHTHGTALGPSTPPLIPPTPADFLSKTVKVQD